MFSTPRRLLSVVGFSQSALVLSSAISGPKHSQAAAYYDKLADLVANHRDRQCKCASNRADDQNGDYSR